VSSPDKTPKRSAGGDETGDTRRGPKPERLKIAGKWEKAVEKALRKPPPKSTKKATTKPKKRGK